MLLEHILRSYSDLQTTINTITVTLLQIVNQAPVTYLDEPHVVTNIRLTPTPEPLLTLLNLRTGETYLVPLSRVKFEEARACL